MELDEKEFRFIYIYVYICILIFFIYFLPDICIIFRDKMFLDIIYFFLFFTFYAISLHEYA